MATPPRFERFADVRGRFFGELALHNDRDWFAAHRETYERGWRQPMQALLEEVRARLGRGYPGPLLPPKIFRIQRDVRFGRDKSPYKTNIGGLLPLSTPGGRSQVEVPAALYFHVGFEETFTAAGLYGMDPETLRRHRAALLDPRRGRELDRVVAGLRARGFGLEAREALKRVPKGVDPDHPRADLLKLKGLIAVGPALERRLLVSRALVDRLVEDARAAAPLVRWLTRVAG